MAVAPLTLVAAMIALTERERPELWQAWLAHAADIQERGGLHYWTVDEVARRMIDPGDGAPPGSNWALPDWQSLYEPAWLAMQRLYDAMKEYAIEQGKAGRLHGVGLNNSYEKVEVGRETFGASPKLLVDLIGNRLWPWGDATPEDAEQVLRDLQLEIVPTPSTCPAGAEPVSDPVKQARLKLLRETIKPNVKPGESKRRAIRRLCPDGELPGEGSERTRLDELIRLWDSA